MDADKLFPLFVAAVCVAMLVRMVLGEERRARIDHAFTQAWLAWRRRALWLWMWRSRRQSAAHAKQVADEVINRVRHRVEKEGNVLTPEAFKGPRKPH
jgi:hypothetical protein